MLGESPLMQNNQEHGGMEKAPPSDRRLASIIHNNLHNSYLSESRWVAQAPLSRCPFFFENNSVATPHPDGQIKLQKLYRGKQKGEEEEEREKADGGARTKSSGYGQRNYHCSNCLSSDSMQKKRRGNTWLRRSSSTTSSLVLFKGDTLSHTCNIELKIKAAG